MGRPRGSGPLLGISDHQTAVAFLEHQHPARSGATTPGSAIGTRVVQARDETGRFTSERVIDEAPFARDGLKQQQRKHTAHGLMDAQPFAQQLEQELADLKARYGLSAEDELAILQAADGLGGIEAAIPLAFTWLCRANDLDDMLADYVKRAGVEVDVIDELLDQTIEAGDLPDYDDPALDGHDPDAGQADDDEPLTAAEIADHFGLHPDDAAMIEAFAEEAGLDHEDAFHQLADHLGLDLAQLEAAAAAAGSGHGDHTSDTDDGSGGEPGPDGD